MTFLSVITGAAVLIFPAGVIAAVMAALVAVMRTDGIRVIEQRTV